MPRSMREAASIAGVQKDTMRRRLNRLDELMGGRLLRRVGNRIEVDEAVLAEASSPVAIEKLATRAELKELAQEVEQLRQQLLGLRRALGA